MSIFSSSSSTTAIVADYFGDEFGLALPLPPIKKATDNAATNKPTAPVAASNSAAAAKVLISCRNKNERAPVLAPMFDGLHCFETFILPN
ncbi:hypothetical protein SLE2022_339730 [Rubroshorea leprosula]